MFSNFINIWKTFGEKSENSSIFGGIWRFLSIFAENLVNVSKFEEEKNIVKDYPEVVLSLDKKLSKIRNLVVSSNDSNQRDKKIENVLKRLGYVWFIETKYTFFKR